MVEVMIRHGVSSSISPFSFPFAPQHNVTDNDLHVQPLHVQFYPTPRKVASHSYGTHTRPPQRWSSPFCTSNGNVFLRVAINFPFPAPSMMEMPQNENSSMIKGRNQIASSLIVSFLKQINTKISRWKWITKSNCIQNLLYPFVQLPLSTMFYLDVHQLFYFLISFFMS